MVGCRFREAGRGEELPHQLRRYFADLNFHFMQSHIMDDQEHKGHCCRYVDVDTAELSELIFEFSNCNKLFADFTQVIYKLYPGSGEECRWLVADLEKLVEEICVIIISILSQL